MPLQRDAAQPEPSAQLATSTGVCATPCPSPNGTAAAGLLMAC
jgi:hypothetical protein